MGYLTDREEFLQNCSNVKFRLNAVFYFEITNRTFSNSVNTIKGADIVPPASHVCYSNIIGLYLY